VYVGHVGAALGGKRLAPAAAMGSLVFAAYLPDWVDAALCLSGRYHDVQMFSHSVPAALVLALLAAATQFRRADARTAAVIAAVVLSHILLDYLTGIKPTWPGGPVIGLQIYRYPVLDFAIEAAVIITGWMFYRKTLPATTGRWNGSHLMLAVLLSMQLAVDAARLLFPSVNKC
jgi:membrane-bound metal-dependent hydrolase YbcI (DUF457 family)